MRKKYGILALWAGLMLFALTGCLFQSVDDLYAIPEAPAEYWALQQQLELVVAEGGEYIAPLTGEYTQSIQLQDLDGDGVDEAIAFFRNSSDERPLKIYIYRQVDEEYALLSVIEGTGMEINTVYYEQLDDSDTKELVVSWQMSDKLHSLAAYSIAGGEASELLRTEYSHYELYDLDMDNQKEVIVLTQGAGETLGRVDFYNVYDGIMSLESSANLSSGNGTLLTEGVVKGYLQANIPAMFVPSSYGESSQGVITDIFAWVGGKITNISMDEESGESGGTVHWYNTSTFASDINGDNITELPLSIPMQDLTSSGGAINFWFIRWMQYNVSGEATQIYQTYHNQQDGWYFVFPEDWENKIILERQDVTDGSERAVVFSYWADEETDPEPFLTIYTLTGSSRQSRANLSGRFSLVAGDTSEDTTLYVAKFTDSTWDCGLDEAGVMSQFYLITTTW